MKTQIGVRIELILKYFGMTQKSVSERLGVSPQTISTWVKGSAEPGVEKIGRITQVFQDVNPRWLLTGEGSMMEEIKPIFTSEGGESYQKTKTSLELVKDKIRFHQRELEFYMAIMDEIGKNADKQDTTDKTDKKKSKEKQAV